MAATMPWGMHCKSTQVTLVWCARDELISAIMTILERIRNGDEIDAMDHDTYLGAALETLNEGGFTRR
jgi:hypothetical protein